MHLDRLPPMFREHGRSKESMPKSKIVKITLEVSQKVDVERIANNSFSTLLAICVQDGLNVASQKCL